MRKKNRIMWYALLVLCILFAGAVVLLAFGKTHLDQYLAQIESLNVQLEENKRTVYVAKGPILKGQRLEEDINVMQQTIYSGLESQLYLGKEDLGSRLLVDVQEGVPLLKSMAAREEISEDTREYEILVANLMTGLKENDVVDVRILFPNGEDYLILAKKQVKGLFLQNADWYTNLSEEEILRMASATIDAYQITGSRIYVTRYVESNIQEKGIPNYLVKASTIDLINSDPNVLDKAQETLNLLARTELENRLAALTKEQLEAAAQGFGLEDTAKTSVLGQTAGEAMEAETEDTEEMMTQEDE